MHFRIIFRATRGAGNALVGSGVGKHIRPSRIFAVRRRSRNLLKIRRYAGLRRAGFTEVFSFLANRAEMICSTI